ncbi:MAG: substrate-binding domain-containing protein [Lentisphaeria bacterium]|nr:substrate-binding domain-containing protein [Lentisphaeria bacterium]
MERKKDQVYGQLKRAIMDGTLSPGSRLPTEKELSRSLEVGQVTLRSALARLEAEGLVERIRSRGTFVTEHCKRRTFLLIQQDGTENLETPGRYIASGLEEEAEKQAVTLEICPESIFLSFSPEERRELVRSHSISGIILETGHRMVSDKAVSAVRELELPVVIPHGLAGDAGKSGFFVLRTDEKSAFKEAYHFLVSKGHKRIASLFLRIPGEDPGELRGFCRGELEDFLKDASLAGCCDLIGHISNNPDEIRARVLTWFELPEPPTAILCHSDRTAMRVYSVLREIGKRVPEDVSVMGYSNYPGSKFLLPPLATIDTRLKECARMALEKLLLSGEWYAPGKKGAEAFTPYVLIERASVTSIK